MLRERARGYPKIPARSCWQELLVSFFVWLARKISPHKKRGSTSSIATWIDLIVVMTDGCVDRENQKGYAAAVAPDLYQGTVDGGRGPDFSLAEGGGIEGRVVNGQGEGIPDVEI
jgi:hypothetical protein